MDELYVRKVLNGDNEAFRYFVNTYKDFECSLWHSIVKCTYLAEEAVRYSYIKALENLKAFKHNSSFKTWLGHIVINESLRKIAQEKGNTLPLDAISEKEIISINIFLKQIQQSDQKTCISLAFEQLPAETSLVLESFYINDLSIKEIGALTG